MGLKDFFAKKQQAILFDSLDETSKKYLAIVSSQIRAINTTLLNEFPNLKPIESNLNLELIAFFYSVHKNRQTTVFDRVSNLENVSNSIVKLHLNLCRASQVLCDSIFKQIKYYDSLCEEYDEENTPLDSNSMLIIEVVNRLLYLTNKKTHSPWGDKARELPVNLDIFFIFRAFGYDSN